MQEHGVTVPLTDDARQHILQKVEEMALQGLRVIALAHRFIESSTARSISRDNAEGDLVFLGLVGMFDPPRPETADAVQACQDAGIIVHMCVCSATYLLNV